MSKYHNGGKWIKRYCILCSKTYNTLHSCHNFPAGSQQAARGAGICETSLLWLVKSAMTNGTSLGYICLKVKKMTCLREQKQIEISIFSFYYSTNLPKWSYQSLNDKILKIGFVEPQIKSEVLKEIKIISDKSLN